MFTTRRIVSSLSLVLALSTTTLAFADATPSWGPKWTDSGELIMPKNFHKWVFLGSPITPNGLNGGNAPFPEFHNVYIQPQAFDIYQKTGEFPEGTIMLKELQLTIKGTEPDGSRVEPSGRGYFPDELHGIDISVKDTKRFKDTNGWGYFNFGHHAPPYAKTAKAQDKSNCAACHIENAHKDMVYTKFYRILEAK